MPDHDVQGSEINGLITLAVSFRDHGTHERGRLAGAIAKLGPFPERCLVQTCHRSELVAVAHELPIDDIGARVFRGRDAVERVFLVAAGLDSAILAEEQILGQVRDAHGLALSRGETGPLLNELFRRAIHFGKHVRSLSQPTADRSLADVAARWAIDRAAATRPSSALVVGTGEMGRLLATRFAASGLRCTIASRSLERASRLADALPRVDGASHLGVDLDVDELARLVRSHRVVALALKRPSPVLRAEDITELPVDVIDLSAPPAVTADAEAMLGDRLLNLDRLGRRGAASALTPGAERRVREQLVEETDRYLAWLIARRHGPAAALYREAEALRARHIGRLSAGGELTEAQLAAVERMTAALVAELVHLRGAAAREELVREELLSGTRA